MFYVYILESQKDKTLYIGLTKNLKKRFEEHNLGLSKFTKGHLPYKLVSYTAFHDKLLAAKFEQYLKTASGKAFIKKRLIS